MLSISMEIYDVVRELFDYCRSALMVCINLRDRYVMAPGSLPGCGPHWPRNATSFGYQGDEKAGQGLGAESAVESLKL